MLYRNYSRSWPRPESAIYFEVQPTRRNDVSPIQTWLHQYTTSKWILHKRANQNQIALTYFKCIWTEILRMSVAQSNYILIEKAITVKSYWQLIILRLNFFYNMYIRYCLHWLFLLFRDLRITLYRNSLLTLILIFSLFLAKPIYNSLYNLHNKFC